MADHRATCKRDSAVEDFELTTIRLDVQLMPLYLTQFSYTPQTWARVIGKPEDRRATAQQSIESVGGKMHGFWYAFGDHDADTVWEAPDNVSMAARRSARGPRCLFRCRYAAVVEQPEPHRGGIVTRNRATNMPAPKARRCGGPVT